MRKITASEVKPGMTIRFDFRGWDVGGTVTIVEVLRHWVWVSADDDGRRRFVELERDTPVTVLSEPAPPQPEEPTEFGARVRVRDGRFVRLGDADLRRHLWHEEGTGYRWTWDDLCEMGPVTVIPDQGWTVPDTPAVPDRIEEWPEDDEHLRDHKWRDVDGDVWVYTWDGWRWFNKHTGKAKLYGFRTMPLRSPWERVSDA